MAKLSRTKAPSLPALIQTGQLHPALGTDPAMRLRRQLEKLAEAGAGNGLLFMIHAHLWAGWLPLLKFSPVSAALVKKKKALLAFAATEPQSGSDIFRLATCARKSKDGWILDGKKSFITNATKAGFLLVLARPENAKHAQDIACFLIPANAKGLTRRRLKLMSLTGADVGEITLKGVKVKDSQLVGNPRQGGEVFRYAMAWERSLILATAPARLEALAKELEAAALKKLRGGAPLAHNVRFASALASVREQAEEIRAMTLEAAEVLDQGGNPFLISARTKLQASILYEEASRILLQLGGKEALLEGSAIAENFRDSCASSIYSGPNDVLGALLEAAQ